MKQLECEMINGIYLKLNNFLSFSELNSVFCRIYKIYRICRILFLVVLKVKITKN